MKKLLVIAALVAGTVSLSSAQGQGGQQRTPEERAKMSVDRMKTTITSLSADQEAKLIALSLAQSKSQDSLSAAITAKVTSVLNDDQKKTYAAYIAERGNRGGFGGGGQRGGGAGGTMPSPEERAKMSVERLKTAASLTLTPEQEGKLLAIMVDQSKAQTALAAAISAKTLAILNDEQKKAYTTMLEQRRQGGQGGGGPRPAGQ
ncbi:hypothetical protein WG906_02375 [Pedobacter sp. P351]|uniref:hypothetical protein n=1 Tax=Pedobacter superstes TaxID=3133441 RepID=UPI00309BF105